MKINLLVLFLSGALMQASAQAPVYPLKLDPSHRYLVDQNNTPVFVHGDSAWSLAAQLTASQAASYFSNQAGLGFNSMIVNVLEHNFSANPPYNVYGVPPFTNHVGSTTDWDMSSVNPDYYTNLDAILISASQYGIQLLLDPAFIGKYCSDLGWCSDMTASGSNALYSYGQFLGDRYQSYPNIIWLNGGDYAFDQTLVNALLNGIMSKDTNHLALAETDADTPGFYYTGAWNEINTVYTWNFTAIPDETISEYAASGAPVILIEGLYEGNPAGPDSTGDLECRNQAFWAVFDGACGHFYGKEPLWKFLPNWQTNLNSPGAVTMQFIPKLMNSRPWYACTPDTNYAAIIDGYGDLGEPTFCPVLRHSSGATVMAYIAGQSGSQATLTSDLTSLSGGSANCWWFNPRDGSATNIGTFAATGAMDFTTPDANDWVLVLDDASQGFTAPGSGPAIGASPVITSQPQSLVVNLGSDATFSVSATSVTNLTYQWWFNGTHLLAGATNSSVTLTNVQDTDAGYYSVIVNNGVAVSSSNALLTINHPLVLEIHNFSNLNQAVPDGDAAGLSNVQTFSSSIASLTAVRVKLTVAGEFNGDLYGYVRHISPAQTNFCVLLNRVGRTDTDDAGYADSGFDITLDDAASNGDIHVYQDTVTPAAGAPLTGTWQPDGRNVDPSIVVTSDARTTTLSSFANASGSGEWTLFLADLESGGTNMLVSWELQLSGAATPAVLWADPADIVYGTALSAAQLNASSPVDGTFTYLPPAGTVLNAGAYQALAVTFTPTDTSNYISVTTNVVINVLEASTTGIVSSSANPSLPGQLITFSMTLSAVPPGAGPPAGSVQFKVDGIDAGSAVALSGGTALYSISTLALGTHTVTAEYPGDGNFLGTTNTLTPVQLVNTPPVPGADTIYRWPTNGTKVSVADLLANDSDADGDPVTFVSVSATSANGGTLLLSNDWIFYTPASGFTNTDAFTYTISDGRGAPVTGTVTVAIKVDSTRAPALVVTYLGAGAYEVRFDGIPGRTYRIQYSEDLIVWQPLSSGTADESGLFRSVDTPPEGSPKRFYRSVYP